MKKIIVILLALNVISTSFSSCDLRYFTSKSLGVYPVLYLQKFVKILFEQETEEQKKKEELEEMFSQTAKDSCENLSVDIDLLIDRFSGKGAEWRDNGSGGGSKIADHGKVYETISGAYIVTVDNAEYTFLIEACVKDTENDDNVGIFSIYFNSDGNVDGIYNHREDSAFSEWYEDLPFGVSSPLKDSQ